MSAQKAMLWLVAGVTLMGLLIRQGIESKPVYAYVSCPIFSTYNYLSDMCECNYGYVYSGGKCISENQYCQILYGYNAQSSLGKCECRYGYVLDPVRSECVNGDTYCSQKYNYHSSYDYVSKVCECDYGYVWNLLGNKCISRDEYCEEEYGAGAESSGVSSCQCKSGYLWNDVRTLCVDADDVCQNFLGYNSHYDDWDEECVCDDDYLIVDDEETCITKEDYCYEKLGDYSEYLGDRECGCDYGYVLTDETCITEEEFCEDQLGAYSEYEGDLECMCIDGYEFTDYGCQKISVVKQAIKTTGSGLLSLLKVGGVLVVALAVISALTTVFQGLRSLFSKKIQTTKKKKK
ncbi:hypothetical protein A2415_00235 [candidate division WWE3 bacterium RIFOXYC1_FULL_39_7]|uniref:Uncharacterized protein n=1 Tax=candidate division WWE3 bacterium RIFOXYC1_FULL_39_7 TaxID=1802643 RepID=A0A1F4WI55_UNCKA|nr:MAG: hypothetical protein A2415_00235 [candidate division WWE3 bacterium RIFOXYC1_FULL_39_7]